MIKDIGNQFPISKSVELVQCLWLLLLKVCSYFHKIEEDNFVAQWRTVNQNWELHSEIVEENKVFYKIMLIRRWLVDFWFKHKMWADFCHFWPTNCVEFFCKLCIKIRKYTIIFWIKIKYSIIEFINLILVLMEVQNDFGPIVLLLLTSYAR